jgi:Rrf2 family protein
MFSQTVQYALRAMAYLAAGDGTPMTGERIAGATGIPAGYLSKVMRAMVVGELVESSRGRHGGFALARPASRISLLDIVDAIGPAYAPRRPGADAPPALGTHAAVDERISTVLRAVQQAFEATTLADLVQRLPGGEARDAPGHAA